MYTYILWSEGGEKFEVMEAVRLRVGLRSVEVSEGRLRVNGRAVTLRGVNRHEHTADAGHVISVQVDIFEKSACISICSGCQLASQPPKNGEIALLLTTNSLMCSKYVSQKRNEAIDNCQWYNMLLNFIL